MTALPELGYGRTWPDADTFGVLARDRRVIPVVRRLMADAETPLSVYRKLAKGEPGTFLLESAEQGVWSRWSIIGARSRATLTERDGEALWIGLGGALLLVLAYAALHTARGLARHAVLFGAAGCIFGLWGAAMLLGAGSARASTISSRRATASS